MPKYIDPGVYIEEMPLTPRSIADVATAIPAFIGYTEKAAHQGRTLVDRPIRIQTLAEFEDVFGGSACGTCGKFITVVLDESEEIESIEIEPRYFIYDSIRLYFANGGGPCYIVSVGAYRTDGSVSKDELERGIDALSREDEPTILVVPEAVLTGSDELTASIHAAALAQCGERGDRIAILDIREGFRAPDDGAPIENFRNSCTSADLTYGAAYYPWLSTTLPLDFDYHNLTFRKPDPVRAVQVDADLPETQHFPETAGATAGNLERPAKRQNPLYAKVADRVRQQHRAVPAGGAIAGVYARVDNTRGVWKSPADVSLNAVSGPAVALDNAAQDTLNTDADSGISVNAIREFPGKGTLVWGARTMAGNDAEWRYISVRRFCIMVEESVKKSTAWAVFETNDADTWARVKSMIGNYLIQKWKDGALLGDRPERAFYVQVGLGATMTQLDILEGRMIVEIGLAVVRPAEFIILRFSHKMAEA